MTEQMPVHDPTKIPLTDLTEAQAKTELKRLGVEITKEARAAAKRLIKAAG